MKTHPETSTQPRTAGQEAALFRFTFDLVERDKADGDFRVVGGGFVFAVKRETAYGMAVTMAGTCSVRLHSPAGARPEYVSVAS